MHLPAGRLGWKRGRNPSLLAVACRLPGRHADPFSRRDQHLRLLVGPSAQIDDRRFGEIISACHVSQIQRVTSAPDGTLETLQATGSDFSLVGASMIGTPPENRRLMASYPVGLRYGPPPEARAAARGPSESPLLVDASSETAHTRANRRDISVAGNRARCKRARETGGSKDMTAGYNLDIPLTLRRFWIPVRPAPETTTERPAQQIPRLRLENSSAQATRCEMGELCTTYRISILFLNGSQGRRDHDQICRSCGV